jgi:hypothetical protein
MPGTAPSSGVPGLNLERGVTPADPFCFTAKRQSQGAGQARALSAAAMAGLRIKSAIREHEKIISCDSNV